MGNTFSLLRAPPSENPPPASSTLPHPLGPHLRKLWAMHSGYHPLNHGSFGAAPLAITARQAHYQVQCDQRPDPFIRYTEPGLIDASRAALATLLRAPGTETVVLVENATVGINTVLRNLSWTDDGCDEIVLFNTAYGSCARTVDYVVNASYGRVRARVIPLKYPCADAEIVSAFRDAVTAARKAGRRPVVCMFDTVSSVPGVRFPFEKVTKACRDEQVLSLVDGAQGIGMIPLDLGALDPDFLVSNAHKWLYTPRGCAVLYVPLRNQHLIPSTLPTSHGYVSPSAPSRMASPLPPSAHGRFVHNFQYTGTADRSPFFCAKDAIEWREKVLGGEERIMKYQMELAKEGGWKVAEILGTKVMDNERGTLTQCALVNVSLPLAVATEELKDSEDLGEKEVEKSLPSFTMAEALVIRQWIEDKLVKDYDTFLPVYLYRRRIWVRLSAQVYLGLEDFEWAGRTLDALCKRIVKGEFRTSTEKKA